MDNVTPSNIEKEKEGEGVAPSSPEPSTLNLLEDTKRVVDELKSERESLKKDLDELRELTARQLLGGKSSVNREAEPVKEETPKEYKDRIMSGKF